MKLKSVLDSLDSVDEALKPVYTEKDGKFYLNVEGFDPNEVEVLRNTMRRAKEEKKTAEKELNDLKDRFAGLPDDFTADDYNSLLDKSGGKVDQRLIEQRERLTKSFEAKEKALQEKLDVATSRANSLVIETALNEAMSKANITMPAMQKAVRAIHIADAKVDYEGDKPVVTIENMPIVDKIMSYASTEEGKYFVTGNGNGGGGAGGQGGGTPPISYEKMSNTQLMLAQDKDPRAKAEMERRTKMK